MKLKDKIQIPKYSLCEELINSISHGIGALLSIAFLILCIVKSNTTISVVASIIYGTTSIMLYTISCIYHALKPNNGKRVLRILDHCSIFLLITGTYAPYALISLPRKIGLIVIFTNLICATVGIVLNSIDLNKYKKISMILYLLMGWIVVFTIKDIIKCVPAKGLYLMLSGGILYTIGSVFYLIGKEKKYMHCVFHIFVLMASVLFFLSIYFYVL